MGFTSSLVSMGMELAVVWHDESEAEERERAEKLKAQYPGARFVDSPGAVLDADVDLVLCCSQAWRHLEHCRPFIEKKVPLFIDKPTAQNYEEARKIFDLVEQHDAPVMACSVKRYSDNFGALFDAMKKGALGEMLFAECFVPHNITPGYWQDSREKSGGLAVNFGIHAVDVLIAGFGTGVRSVYATGSKLGRPESDSEDTALIQITFDTGLTALAKIGGGYHFKQAKASLPTVASLTLHGTLATLETRMDESDVRVWNGGVFGVSNTYHLRTGKPQTMEALMGMVETKQRPIPLEEMDAVMKVLDAARRSIDTGEVIHFK